MDRHCASWKILQVHETVNSITCSAFEVNSSASVSSDMKAWKCKYFNILVFQEMLFYY